MYACLNSPCSACPKWLPAVDEVAHGVIFTSLHSCVKALMGFSSGLGGSTLLEDNGREPWGFFTLSVIGNSWSYSPLCPTDDQKCSVHVLLRLLS